MTDEKEKGTPENRAERRGKGRPAMHAKSRLVELFTKHREARGTRNNPGGGRGK
jgi:hypothetical protein